jgi:hypothetical protein
MEVDLFFLAEKKVLAKQLFVLHIPGTGQLEDSLTKPISTEKFLFNRTTLNVRDYTELGGGECDCIVCNPVLVTLQGLTNPISIS